MKLGSPRKRRVQVDGWGLVQRGENIPDDAAADLAVAGHAPARALLEAYALEGYRRQVSGESAVRRLLGFETRMEVHAFLKEHGVYLNYSQEDLEHDLAEARRYPPLKAALESSEHRAG
jgi:Uncharacterised protein family (UPF0175)